MWGIIVPNEENYTVSSFKAPYLERTELKNSKWSSTIEGSRAASGAAATWLTGKSLGFESREFAQLIADTFQARIDFENQLVKECPWAQVLRPSETNILCFSVADKKDSLSLANKKTLSLFNKIAQSPHFSASKTTLGKKEYHALIKKHVKSHDGELDADHLVLMRCVFMNPFWSKPKIGKSLRTEIINEMKTYC